MSATVSTRQLWWAVLCGLLTMGRPQSYYTVNRGSSVRGRGGSERVLLDTLQRGHEGLLVQLDHINNAIKEDELKLNNVFYKLGRHDTDIQSTNSLQISLRDSARKLEAKLNKQSYNVDFLRRHVLELKRGIVSSASAVSSVAGLKETVADLQQSLAQSLYRTQMLENKTTSMQAEMHAMSSNYSPGGIDDSNIYYASSIPKTTYYYLNSDSIADICPESGGWVTTDGGGCWWVGEEAHTFTGAMVACTQRGAVLGQLPPSQDQWPTVLKKRIKRSSSSHYWTCGTDAFTPGAWVFLSSGDSISPEQWAVDAPLNEEASGKPISDCAVMTDTGLRAEPCSMRYLYVCKRL